MGFTSLKCQGKKVCPWKWAVHALLDAACASLHPQQRPPSLSLQQQLPQDEVTVHVTHLNMFGNTRQNKTDFGVNKKYIGERSVSS